MTVWKPGDRVELLAPPGGIEIDAEASAVVGSGARVVMDWSDHPVDPRVIVEIDGEPGDEWAWGPDDLRRLADDEGPIRRSLPSGWRWGRNGDAVHPGGRSVASWDRQFGALRICAPEAAVRGIVGGIYPMERGMGPMWDVHHVRVDTAIGLAGAILAVADALTGARVGGDQ